MPVIPKPTGKGNEINGYFLADIIREMIFRGATCMWIERVGAMPRDGKAGAFSFGRAAGAPYYIAATLNLRCRQVAPITWKRHHRLLRQDKQQSRALALSMWPAMRDQFRLNRHVDRAEAALIAAYGGSQ